MKAVLFDLGHTLINYHNDWRGPERRAVEAVSDLVLGRSSNGTKREDVASKLLELLARARNVKNTEFLEVPLESVLNNCFTYFSVEEEEDLMQESLEIFYGVLLERRDLVPGTLEMLQVLRDEGYSIGLVSDVAWGLPSYFPLRDMEHFGLDEYFDDMVFSTDVGLRKPNPRIFKIALYNVGAKAEEAVFVGNNLQCDIKGALGVGMTAILKTSDFYTHDESIVPSYKIDDWTEFEDLLRKI
jgi:putative hydrolase of the HAD superfamily